MKTIAFFLLVLSLPCWAQMSEQLSPADIEALTKTMNAENRAKFERELKEGKETHHESESTTLPPVPAVDLSTLNTNGMSAADKEMLNNVNEQVKQIKSMQDEIQKELDN